MPFMSPKNFNTWSYVGLVVDIQSSIISKLIKLNILYRLKDKLRTEKGQHKYSLWTKLIKKD